MEDKEWVLNNVEQICADTNNVDEICMALEHSTIFIIEMIQDFSNDLLKMDLKNKRLQQENQQLRERLKNVEEYIFNHDLYGMKYGKTLYRESLINILKIIKGDE